MAAVLCNLSKLFLSKLSINWLQKLEHGNFFHTGLRRWFFAITYHANMGGIKFEGINFHQWCNSWRLWIDFLVDVQTFCLTCQPLIREWGECIGGRDCTPRSIHRDSWVVGRAGSGAPHRRITATLPLLNGQVRVHGLYHMQRQLVYVLKGFYLEGHYVANSWKTSALIFCLSLSLYAKVYVYTYIKTTG